MKVSKCVSLAAVSTLLLISSSQVFALPNTNDEPGRVHKNAPAPIPGILALMAAAGGGALLRRKSKKGKSGDE